MKPNPQPRVHSSRKVVYCLDRTSPTLRLGNTRGTTASDWQLDERRTHHFIPEVEHKGPKSLRTRHRTKHKSQTQITPHITLHQNMSHQIETHSTSRIAFETDHNANPRLIISYITSKRVPKLTRAHSRILNARKMPRSTKQKHVL